MHVIGIGIEIVDCARVAKMIEKHGEDFLQRVYTEREIVHCSQRAAASQHYAARWACKQAVFKALDAVKQATSHWKDVETRGTLRRGLRVAVGGPIKRLCQEKKVARLAVSASFTRGLAVAQALAIGLPTE